MTSLFKCNVRSLILDYQSSAPLECSHKKSKTNYWACFCSLLICANAQFDQSVPFSNLSFSIGTDPQLILWKRSYEDWNHQWDREFSDKMLLKKPHITFHNLDEWTLAIYRLNRTDNTIAHKCMVKFGQKVKPVYIFCSYFFIFKMKSFS